MPEFDRRLLAAGLIILLIGFVGGMKYGEMKAGQAARQQALISSLGGAKQDQVESETTKDIKVYATGAVKKPGVYTLREGDRVYQVVEMAGGLLPEADIKNINLAAVLQDGKSILIPLKGENPVSNDEVMDNAGALSGGKVNINTASSRELDPLPGIGPSLAQRIVEYRQLNGLFQRVEDLKKVSGIGDKKFEALKDQICVK